MDASLIALAALGGGEAQISRSDAGPSNNQAVSYSAELQRIQALPRRGEAFFPVDVVHKKGTKKNAKKSLRPLQALALAEAMHARGLFAPLAVGAGKTLLALLLPTMLDIGPSVILTNAGLVRQALRLMREYAADFNIRTDIRWLSYGVLSSPTQFEVLRRLAPKLIVADECQALSNPDAARTKRFKRYMADNPETLFAAMSGSITRRSTKDYAHLLHLALKDRTPLPRDWKTLTEWADAVDPSDRPRAPGALLELMTDEHAGEFLHTRDPEAIKRGRMYLRGAAMRAHRFDSDESAQIQELARDVLRRRMVESVGVIASTKNDQDAKLELAVVPTPPCPLIAETLAKVQKFWERPDGELLTFGLEIARVVHHVKLGGYYRWVWPEKVSKEQKAKWLEARKNYRSELRDFLKHGSKEGLDSPHLVERAIKRGDLAFDHWEGWVAQEEAMRPILGSPQPPSEWVWISKALVDAAAKEIVERGDPMIIWSDTSAIGQEIAKVAKCPYYGAGPDAQHGILNEIGERTIVASIKAHGTGRNLQAYARALVVGCPSSGDIWEQLLGRLHRPGQEADTVRFEVYDAFLDELKSAIRYAKYQEQTFGNEQKLLHAAVSGIEKGDGGRHG